MNFLNDSLFGGMRRDVPVAPLPPIVGQPELVPPLGPDFQEPAAPGPGPSYPVAPLPPMVNPNPPAAPGPDYPVFPIAPPPNNNYPVFPIAPSPSLPSYPGTPSSGYCRVRFLHAAANFVPFNISIDYNNITSGLAYGNICGYTRVPDGFRTVTVMSARAPRAILYRTTIPFRAGESVTLVIVNAHNGLDIQVVSDTPCERRPHNMSCLRMANMSFDSPALDLILGDRRVVFSDVYFKEVTNFKKVRPGDYDFFVTQTPHVPMPIYDIETLEQMPIYLGEDLGSFDYYLSFYLRIRPNTMYTLYLIGQVNGSPPLSVLVVEN